jgi:sulfur-oxidizing protein SoxZ
MQHEMENGRRKDEAGNVVPAWFIAEVTMHHAGRVVLEAQFGTSVAKNPYLIFRFKGGQAGDKLTLSWVDNRGESRVDEVAIG